VDCNFRLHEAAGQVKPQVGRMTQHSYLCSESLSTNHPLL